MSRLKAVLRVVNVKQPFYVEHSILGLLAPLHVSVTLSGVRF